MIGQYARRIAEARSSTQHRDVDSPSVGRKFRYLIASSIVSLESLDQPTLIGIKRTLLNVIARVREAGCQGRWLGTAASELSAVISLFDYRFC